MNEGFTNWKKATSNTRDICHKTEMGSLHPRETIDDVFSAELSIEKGKNSSSLLKILQSIQLPARKWIAIPGDTIYLNLHGNVSKQQFDTTFETPWQRRCTYDTVAGKHLNTHQMMCKMKSHGAEYFAGCIQYAETEAKNFYVSVLVWDKSRCCNFLIL